MQLKAPRCHWSECGRTMQLINESDTFWFFACGCGCTRALSKPSVRAESLYKKTQSEIDQIRRLQQYRNSRPAWSFPGHAAPSSVN